MMDGEFLPADHDTPPNMAIELAANFVEEWWTDFPETVMSDPAMEELVKRIATLITKAER